MTPLQIFLIIYFTGATTQYFVFRSFCRKTGGYTISGKVIAISISTLSWVSVFCFLASLLIMWIKENRDKPAKW